jgi:hypothetical protein
MARVGLGLLNVLESRRWVSVFYVLCSIVVGERELYKVRGAKRSD